jgi:hypothetical protein
LYLLLAVLDCDVHQLGIFGFLGGGEDERRVGGGILRLVLANAWSTSETCEGEGQ